MSSFYLGNPLGLWALLALPVLVLIHALQQKAKRVRVSTLFLLEKVAPLSAEGARLERFRQSLPFWMQVLAVLFITWMLTEPRWIRPQSEQLVVVVLDTSASMGAFKTKVSEELSSRLPRWSATAGRTRFHLMVTDASAPPLYTGEDSAALLLALDEWQPLKAGHDPARALSIARGLVKRGAGMVVLVTDHPQAELSDVAVLSVGERVDNVGFTGVVLRPDEAGDSRLRWRALLRNAGAVEQTREWWVERRDGKGEVIRSARNRVALEPGMTVIVEGEFPPDVEEADVVVTPDAFALDDRVSMLKPRPRIVKVAVRVGVKTGELVKRLLAAVENVELVTADADVTLALMGDATETDAILIGTQATEDAKLDAAPVAAEHHALMRELNWSGLMTTTPENLPVLESDQPLLWKGSRPLALQRVTQNSAGNQVTQLFLNWDLTISNADRVPAVIVLLHRWLDERRDALPGERVDNFETGQRLALPQTDAKVILADGREARWTGTVPEMPGRFEVMADGKRIVRGVAQFADARESDFRQCATADTTGSFVSESAERSSESDPLTFVWALALLGCLLTAWGWKGRKSAIQH